MHPSCPKKALKADMTKPENVAWCERNRSPGRCWDCEVYGGEKVADGIGKNGHTPVQRMLF